MKLLKYQTVDYSYGTKITDYKISHIDGNLIVIKENNHYGLVKLEGKKVCGNTLIEPKYDIIFEFIGDYAVVYLDKKYGIINKQGEEVVGLNYDYLEALRNKKFIAKKGNKYGIINHSGKTITNFDYDLIFKRTKDNMFLYKLNDKIGLLSTNGKPLTPSLYYKIDFFNHGYAVVTKNDKCGIINKKGEEIIKQNYKKIFIIDNKRYLGCKRSKWYIMDYQGNKIKEFKVPSNIKLKEVHGNYVMVEHRNLDNLDAGLIDLDGNTIIDEMFMIDYQKGIFTISKSFDEYQGLTGKKGNIKYIDNLESIYVITPDLVKLMYDFLSYQFYNVNEDKYIGSFYNYLSDIKNDIALFFKDDKYGLLNVKDGKEIVKNYPSKIEKFFCNDKLIVIINVDNYVVIYDKEGNQIVPEIPVESINLYANNQVIINNHLFNLSELKIDYHLEYIYNRKTSLHKQFKSDKERENYEISFMDKMNPFIDKWDQKRNNYLLRVENFIQNKLNNAAKECDSKIEKDMKKKIKK